LEGGLSFAVKQDKIFMTLPVTGPLDTSNVYPIRPV